MIVCFHHTLCAASRALRIQLFEKGLEFELCQEAPWERRAEFLGHNPAGDLPVLFHEDVVIAGGYATMEYLEDVFPDPCFLGGTAVLRAEIRRLVHWFLYKFQDEVTQPIIGEKLIKRISGQGAPNSKAISAGRINIHTHLSYISWLMERRSWLAGDSISLADIIAASQLSVLDFAGEVPWSRHPDTKDWYVRVKSRPSFRPLLADKILGIYPPPHYQNLDF